LHKLIFQFYVKQKRQVKIDGTFYALMEVFFIYFWQVLIIVAEKKFFKEITFIQPKRTCIPNLTNDN